MEHGKEEVGMGRRRWAWEGDGHGKEMGMGRKSWAWEGRAGHGKEELGMGRKRWAWEGRDGYGQVKVGHGNEGWYGEAKVGREVRHGNQGRRMFQTGCGKGGMEKKKGNMVIKLASDVATA